MCFEKKQPNSLLMNQFDFYATRILVILCRDGTLCYLINIVQIQIKIFPNPNFRGGTEIKYFPN